MEKLFAEWNKLAVGMIGIIEVLLTIVVVVPEIMLNVMSRTAEKAPA